MREKFIIYQLLTRAFGNSNQHCVSGGSLSLNGCGKFNDITLDRLHEIKKLQVSYVWYTGIIEHSTKTDYSSYGIKNNNPQIVKGEAGSPYAIKDYFDVDPDLSENVENRMAEFSALVERTHQSGMKVMIDFVPNHLSRDYFSDQLPEGAENFGQNDNTTLSFSKDNNFYYIINEELNLSNILQGEKQTYFESPAKATGNNLFSNTPSFNDWYETAKLNYGVDPSDGSKHFMPHPKSWTMMLQVLKFWVSKGVDGFRCDMAGMVPVEFWSWAIEELKRDYPLVIFVGELYERERYANYINVGGFDYLYDKSGLYDCLKQMSRYYTAKNCSDVAAQPLADSITNSWQFIDKIQNRMVYFIENHDEQRVASDFNLGNPFYALPELMVSLMLNRAPFLLYNGQEYGEKGMLAEGYSGSDGKTSIFDYCSITAIVDATNGDLDHSQIELYNIYLKLLFISMNDKAIRNGELYDLQFANKVATAEKTGFNADSMYTFMRKTRKSIIDSNPDTEMVLCTVDFSQSAKSVKILLPENLFGSWDITPGSHFYQRDILNGGETKTAILGKECLIETYFNKYGLSIIKFSLEK
jgi:glycosidase